jgi:hypothetical protein
VLEIRRRFPGDEHPVTLSLKSLVALQCQEQGRYQEAEASLLDVYEGIKDAPQDRAPRCGHRMKIVSFIDPGQRGVIDGILAHRGLSSRAPPSDARVPPVTPPIRELTCVSDLEFVPDPEPAEPVRSTD